MIKLSRSLGLSALGALAAIIAFTATARGQTFTWNVANGSFQIASSWTPAGGPPGASTTAQFITAGTFQATFDSDWSVNQLTINNGTVHFNMNGRTLNSNFQSIGNVAGLASTWILIDGTYNSQSLGASIGTASGSTTTVSLRNGATYQSLAFTDLATFGNAVVNVTVRDGSRWLNGDGGGGSFIGSAATATATLNVDGAGSRVRLPGGSRIGSSGSGTINVTNGGLLQTRANLILGLGASSTGVVNLVGAGSTWSHDDGFMSMGSGTAKTITVNAGTVLDVVGTTAAAGITLESGTMTVNAHGTANVSGVAGSNVNVTGGTLTVNGAVNVAGAGNGVIHTAGAINLNSTGVLTTTSYSRSGAASLNWSGGQLVIDGGTLSNGGPMTALGTLSFQNGANASGFTSLQVRNSGAGGTLNVLSGATPTINGFIIIGNQAGNTGTANIGGAGSTLTSTGTEIGVGVTSGTGTMNVNSGGRVVATAGPVYAGASGGTGTINLNAGGSIQAASSFLGSFATGTGTANVAGTWTTSGTFGVGGDAIGGDGAAGTLSLNTGGVITVGTNFSIFTPGTLNLNGGSLTAASFTRLGVLSFNDGTLTVNGGTFQNGTAPGLFQLDGSTAAANPTLILTGAATTTTNVASLTVGSARAGTLLVQNGATVTAGTFQIGSLNGSNGTVTLSGAGSALTSTSGGIGVGLNTTGVGTLTIGAGTTATSAGVFLLNTPGTVNLNGGTLAAQSLTLNGGTFNWNSGTLSLTAATSLSSADLTILLGTSHSLNNGKWKNFSGGGLTLDGNLLVDGGNLTGTSLTNNATFVMSGGTTAIATFTNNAGRLTVLQNVASLTAAAVVNSGTLNLNGAATTVNGDVTNNATGLLFGTGTVNGNLTNNGTVRATGSERLTFVGTAHTNNLNLQLAGGTLEFLAPLTVTGAGAITGRGTLVTTGNFPGTPGLTINSGGVLTASSSTFDVYGDTNLQAGSRVGVAGNGILTFYDDVDHNAAEFRIFGASRAVFFGAVTGAGGFQGSTGNVDFFSDYRPGNSPALVTFEGDLNFYSSTALFIELGGLARGSEYDALNVAGLLQVGGDLVLTTLGAFQPTYGDFFIIANRAGGSGQFNGLAEGTLFTVGGQDYRISYQGINYNTGLLAPGATANSLVISAVPEPLTLSLFGLAGASAGASWWLRRRPYSQPRE